MHKVVDEETCLKELAAKMNEEERRLNKWKHIGGRLQSDKYCERLVLLSTSSTDEVKPVKNNAN